MKNRKEENKIFISYSYNDKENANKLVSFLKNHGIGVWYDSLDVAPGTMWNSQIYNQGIKNSNTMIVLYNQKYINSKYGQEEYLFAKKENKNMLIIIKAENLHLVEKEDRYVIIESYDNLNNILVELSDINDFYKIKYLNKLAREYYQYESYHDAYRLYDQSIALSEKYGIEETEMAEQYNNIAIVCQSMGEYEKALLLQKKALNIQEKIFGDEYPNIATSYANLATLYQSMGEYEKALPLYEKSLAIREKVLGEEHPDTARSYNNLAGLYESMGEYEKALLLQKKALNIQEKIFGDEHPSTATSYANLATLYQSMGEYEKALPLYEKSLAIREKVLGEEHPDTARSQ